MVSSGPRLTELHAEARALSPLVRAVVAAVLRERQTHPDVEDCANEALRRALEGSARLREGEPLRPWLVGIARHVALDVLRARRRRREVQDAGTEASGDLAPWVERIADERPDPHEQVESAVRHRQVRRAIDELPANLRVALMKFHLEGKGYQEIAKEMNVPLGTVATWVTRGRKAMAQSLEASMRES